jgi:hypothetical protein
MRPHFAWILITLCSLTLLSCNKQENTDTVRNVSTPIPQNVSTPTAVPVNANGAPVKKATPAATPSPVVPQSSNSSQTARKSSARCPESKIPLCQKLARSSDPPFGPGGVLEGTDLQEGVKIIKECYELKQRGCF